MWLWVWCRGLYAWTYAWPWPTCIPLQWSSINRVSWENYRRPSSLFAASYTPHRHQNRISLEPKHQKKIQHIDLTAGQQMHHDAMCTEHDVSYNGALFSRPTVALQWSKCNVWVPWLHAGSISRSLDWKIWIKIWRRQTNAWSDLRNPDNTHFMWPGGHFQVYRPIVQ